MVKGNAREHCDYGTRPTKVRCVHGVMEKYLWLDIIRRTLGMTTNLFLLFLKFVIQGIDPDQQTVRDEKQDNHMYHCFT